MNRACADRRTSPTPSQTTPCFPKPDQCVYTACYCEENVWKLCDHVRVNHPAELKKCFAVFISNKDRRIPLWYQKASEREDRLVIWDYHVLLVYQGAEGSLVYDLDTELPFPCRLDMYITHAIRNDATLKPDFRRLFRAVAAEEYLKAFASDRSHMLKEDGSWLAEPPSYPCIHTQDCLNNLGDFICMDEKVGIGSVLTAAQLLQKLS